MYLYHIRTSIKHCASSKPRLPRSTFDRIWTFFKRRLWLDKNGFNKLHFSWQIHPNNQPKLPTSHRWSFQHVLSLHPITCPLQVQNEAAALQRHHLWMHVPLFNSATWYPKFRQFCLKRALVLASFPAPQTRKQKVLGRRNKGTPCSQSSLIKGRPPPLCWSPKLWRRQILGHPEGCWMCGHALLLNVVWQNKVFYGPLPGIKERHLAKKTMRNKHDIVARGGCCLLSRVVWCFLSLFCSVFLSLLVLSFFSFLFSSFSTSPFYLSFYVSFLFYFFFSCLVLLCSFLFCSFSVLSSPPARWGSLDFIRAACRLLPGPQPRAPDPSGHCRTSTASARCQIECHIECQNIPSSKLT